MSVVLLGGVTTLPTQSSPILVFQLLLQNCLVVRTTVLEGVASATLGWMMNSVRLITCTL